VFRLFEQGPPGPDGAPQRPSGGALGRARHELAVTLETSFLDAAHIVFRCASDCNEISQSSIQLTAPPTAPLIARLIALLIAPLILQLIPRRLLG
jgi:hypothetical protein